MPILEVEIVLKPGEQLAEELALQLADAAASALGSAAGGTWVRLYALPEKHYAEGGGGPPQGVHPVFVKVLQAELAEEEQRAQSAGRLARALAQACRRPVENVHVLFEPAAAGRIWFGGQTGR